eukprot:1150737-Pelagomonas_calceolata.AAC.2
MQEGRKHSALILKHVALTHSFCKGKMPSCMCIILAPRLCYASRPGVLTGTAIMASCMFIILASRLCYAASRPGVLTGTAGSSSSEPGK